MLKDFTSDSLWDGLTATGELKTYIDLWETPNVADRTTSRSKEKTVRIDTDSQLLLAAQPEPLYLETEPEAQLLPAPTPNLVTELVQYGLKLGVFADGKLAEQIQAALVQLFWVGNSDRQLQPLT
jgi:hypothetical protein